MFLLSPPLLRALRQKGIFALSYKTPTSKLRVLFKLCLNGRVDKVDETERRDMEEDSPRRNETIRRETLKCFIKHVIYYVLK